MNKMNSLHTKRIILIPIPSYRQYLVGPSCDGNHIRQRYLGRFATLIGILKPFKIQINVHLNENMTVIIIISRAFPIQFIILLLYAGGGVRGRKDVYVPV